MRSANPALKADAFRHAPRADTDQGVMTVQGTINKSGFLITLLISAAAGTWYLASRGLMPLGGALIGAGIGGLIVAIATAFKPTWAPVTAPLYALLEGVVIGGVSMLMDRVYPGIAIQAFLGTFGVFLAMLGLYTTGTIKVTAKLRAGVMMATLGVMLLYLASWVLSLVGLPMTFLHDGGPLSIIITLVIIAVAAFNLLLDFDLVESGARAMAPKYMEWYAGFALMVTLVWLYFEILRLLSYLRGD